MIDKENMDDYEDLFEIESLLEEDMTYADAAELVLMNEFDDAYDLLVIRSLTDDSLTDEVNYWTRIRDGLLYEDESIAA